ncbi:Metallo-dependent phosphatase [Hesseltinella vesiculosa]|uniref:Metallo-dependent phosphatase n=1 Tax=Hesseltinella vesiculosa TaxID=101127 RepID=A0A1X2GUZ6_9FUNG|nr:Metallo-dependent phosphatase [Hesseltinella vesiculosa]
MKIAIEGCCHGQLDDIYGTLKLLEEKEGTKIDLLLICGDFQAIRNMGDLQCMAVPPAYRHLGTFWKYYAGIAKAPYPTIFIGGNHEASNYLWELYHGGWVCDNIYYLGQAGVIQYNGVRIGGLSGIFNDHHYQRGHYEKSPYSPSNIRSVYHVREYDVQRLMQIKQPMDVFLSHDWPRGIERYGDLATLLRWKKYFYNEVLSNTLGSPANEQLLTHLKPDYWFSAHLHVKYPAVVDHDKWQKQTYSQAVRDILSGKPAAQTLPAAPVANPDEIAIDDDSDQDEQPEPSMPPPETQPQDDQGNTDEILIDDSDEDGDDDQVVETPNASITRFLSLDKCMPRRGFLQVVDIPAKNDQGFAYDLEWLSIVKAMDPYLSLQHHPIAIPLSDQVQSTIQEALTSLQQVDLQIPMNFVPSHSAHDPATQPSHELIHQWQCPVENQQTRDFCTLLGLDNKINGGCQPPATHEVDSPSKRFKPESSDQ